MLKPQLLIVLVIVFTLKLTAQTPKKGDTLYLNQNTTIYSLPGYDYKSYKEAQESGTFDNLKSLGLQDLIPKKLSWPAKSDKVKFLSEHSDNIYDREGNSTGTYYLVEYDSVNQGLVRGYIDKATINFDSQRETVIKNPSCNLCSEYKINTICQANVFSNLTKVLNNYPNNFKSTDELREYFYKYRAGCRSTEFRLYTAEYETYIKAAAESFQIPEAMLACLLFKENQFMSKRKSTAGARGIAQIVPGTIDYINGVLKKLDYSEQTIDKYNSRIDEYQALVRDNIKLKSKGLKTKPIPSWKRGNYEEAKTKMYLLNLANDYPEYIDKIRETKAFKQKYKNGLPWTGKYPTRFNTKRAENPALAIGASALYLKHVINQFSKQIPDNSLSGEDQHLNFLTAVAGAYNMGPGNAFSFIGSKPSKDPADWVEKLSKSDETKKHMLSIRRCMDKDNNEPPMFYNKQGKLVDQNAC